MRILRTIGDVAGIGDLPRPLGLVPTMGALHDAHRALAARARAECASVIVTIFVNPKQFRAGEDFADYPRNEEADIATTERWGADAVFVPGVETIYPHGFGTVVSIPKASGRLCGAFRPGHFDGVLTVVARLLGLFRPERAYFGWKDAQQLLLIRRMKEDLALPVEIVGVETIREPDGLAFSSRNLMLTHEDRAKAPLLYRALRRGGERLREGVSPEEIIQDAKKLLAAQGFAVEYVEIESFEGVRLLAAAARLGRTRLIDNIRIGAA